jgi:zinc protease
MRQHYGSWRGRRARNRVPTEPAPTGPVVRHVDWAEETAPTVVWAWHTPAFVSGRTEAARSAALRTSAALRVVHGLLLGQASPLYQQLVVNDARVLAFDSPTADAMFVDPSLFVAFAVLADGAEFDAVTGAVQGAIDNLANGEVDAEFMEAVKSNLRYRVPMETQTPIEVAELVARTMTVNGEIGLMDAFLGELEQVTVEDVARVAREMLGERRRVTVTLSQASRSSEEEQ